MKGYVSSMSKKKKKGHARRQSPCAQSLTHRRARNRTRARSDTHTHTCAQRHSRPRTHSVDYGLNYIPYGPERLLPNKLQALTGAGGEGDYSRGEETPPKDKANRGTHKGCRATALRHGRGDETTWIWVRTSHSHRNKTSEIKSSIIEKEMASRRYLNEWTESMFIYTHTRTHAEKYTTHTVTRSGFNRGREAI